MTHKEALDIFKCLAWHDLRPSEEEIEMAFKVLSNNSVLEDIKLELQYMNSAAYMGDYNVGLRDAIKVIDKHMESEDNK